MFMVDIDVYSFKCLIKTALSYIVIQILNGNLSLKLMFTFLSNLFILISLIVFNFISV